MSSDDPEPDDSIEALEEQRKKLEQAGWDAATTHIDERIDDLEEENDLEERLVDLKIKVRQAEKEGLEDDPAVDALRGQITEIADRLDDGDEDEGVDEVEVMEERIDDYERVGWDAAAETAREKLDVEGFGDTKTERVRSKMQRLRKKTSGQDAELLEHWLDRLNSGIVEGFDDAYEFDFKQMYRDKIAALGAKHGVILSEVSDDPADVDFEAAHKRLNRDYDPITGRSDD